MVLPIPRAGAIAVNEPVTRNTTLAGESFSTNYTASAPGPVSLSYTATLSTSTNATMTGPSSTESTPISGVLTLNVTTASGMAVASLNLTNSAATDSANVTVSGTGSAFTLNGTWSDNITGWFGGSYGSTLSYEENGSATANSSFSGSATATVTADTPPACTYCELGAEAVSGTVYQIYPESNLAKLTYSGTFTFYAPAAGTYLITATGPPGYSNQTQWPAPAEDLLEDASASLTVGLPAPSTPSLPTGSLTALKSSGANGVTLQWSITAP